MQLKRIYPHWDAVKAAGGTPSSRKPHVWREVLRTRPAITYWGDAWFSTPLYKNLYWNSFARQRDDPGGVAGGETGGGELSEAAHHRCDGLPGTRIACNWRAGFRQRREVPSCPLGSAIVLRPGVRA